MLLRNTSWHPIRCGGKKAVLKVKDIISSNEKYRNFYTAYFIDRDFDESIVKDHDSFIYETPCYSIENLYCDEKTIKKIISAEFGTSDHAGTDEFFNKIFTIIIDTQNKFHEIIRPFNAYIKAHRLREKNGNIKSNCLNLSNIKINDIIKIELNNIDKVIDPADYYKLFSSGYTLTQTEINNADTFLNENAHYDFRGKFELEFIRIVLIKLRDEISSKESDLYRPGYSIKLTLSKSNCISELSQYATTPQCLIDFLQHLDNHILSSKMQNQSAISV